MALERDILKSGSEIVKAPDADWRLQVAPDAGNQFRALLSISQAQPPMTHLQCLQTFKEHS
jgi:hypothetical protein